MQLSEEHFHKLSLAVMGAVSVMGAKNPATPLSGPPNRIIN
jgi:hypothetical protein